jgi:UDP-glucose 4-epimerase
MKILVTGGTGFIGSHTCTLLLDAGHDVVIVDDFSNSSPDVSYRISDITGRAVNLIEGDVGDPAIMRRCFSHNAIDAVIHFAGWKSVGESVSDPMGYWRNNVLSTLTLLKSMKEFRVKKMVFSSSATVYGFPDAVPIPESAPVRTINPYGSTKAAIEILLRDVAESDPDWHIAMLRYFNPVGAHPTGFLGENPKGIPTNLFPYVMMVAQGQLPNVNVFGSDYPTPDGTGVRDYIHVMDLADGHLAALNFLNRNRGIHTFNLGTGTGYSVLEIIRAMSEASGKDIPFQLVDRRPGDSAESVADTRKAERELGWVATRGLAEMCADGWRWQLNQEA